MAPIATNCDTDVRVHYQRSADGKVRTQITALATLPTRPESVRVELNAEQHTIVIDVSGLQTNGYYRYLRWSSAFPTEPTLGEMIEAAEALARGEWHKLFPEET